jgi:hypothetical protein
VQYLLRIRSAKEEREAIDGDVAVFQKVRHRRWDIATPAGPSPHELEEHAPDPLGGIVAQQPSAGRPEPRWQATPVFHIIAGLTNRGFLGGADRGKPRVDWRDMETYSEGV